MSDVLKKLQVRLSVQNNMEAGINPPYSATYFLPEVEVLFGINVSTIMDAAKLLGFSYERDNSKPGFNIKSVNGVVAKEGESWNIFTVWTGQQIIEIEKYFPGNGDHILLQLGVVNNAHSDS